MCVEKKYKKNFYKTFVHEEKLKVVVEKKKNKLGCRFSKKIKLRERASTAASRHVNQAERIDKQYRGSVIDPQRLRLPKLHTTCIPRLAFYDVRAS